MSKERFVELAKKLEQQQDEINATREELTKVMTELGPDQYAHDPSSGLVYKTFKPNGTFMYYRDIDYKRSAKEGERGGVVLAKKEAEEAIAKGLVS